MNLGPAHNKSSSSTMESLNHHISQAQALIGMYEKSANSEAGSSAGLEQVRREMKVMKNELLAELMRARSILKKMQAQEGGS